MPSLFSFLHPASVPAAGVMLLRLAVGVFAVVLSVVPLQPTLAWTVTAWLVAGTLVAGLLTRAAAFACVVAAVLRWPPSGEGMTGLFVAGTLSALALAVIGAGAWSVDAQLFGRRVIDLDE